MNGETKRVLITVKAYPTPSKKYGETVCVAGIDIDTEQWVRLYPIKYRDLDEDKRFKKYNVIQVRTNKPRDDKRPESNTVDMDSIKIIDYLDAKDGWVKREKIVLPTVSKSMCEILKESETKDKSLGMFKPKNIDFNCSKATPKSKAAREACYAQPTFFNKQKNAIEDIPFDFRYQFFCNGEPLCPGHNYSIIDWEIGQAYRRWQWEYKKVDLLLEKIKERWLTEICSLNNDVYFFAGNMKRFRDKFMILGVFYPPLVTNA